MLFFVLLLNVTEVLSLYIEKRGNSGTKEFVKVGKSNDTSRCSEALLLGKTLHNKYNIKNQIGSGGQAVIYSSTYRGQNFAVKCYKPEISIGTNQVLMESYIQKGLRHPNILKLVDNFEELGHFFQVSEQCETDLARLINSGKPIDIRKIYLQILDAVIYMHKNGKYHRDLKPHNILITSSSKYPTVKLADFGVSTVDEFSDKSFSGTDLYSSPEALDHKVGFEWAKNDVYSLGIILFNLLIGSMPPQLADRTFDAAYRVYGIHPDIIEIFQKVFGESENRPTALGLKQMVQSLPPGRLVSYRFRNV